MASSGSLSALAGFFPSSRPRTKSARGSRGLMLTPMASKSRMGPLISVYIFLYMVPCRIWSPSRRAKLGPASLWWEHAQFLPFCFQADPTWWLQSDLEYAPTKGVLRIALPAWPQPLDCCLLGGSWRVVGASTWLCWSLGSL